MMQPIESIEIVAILPTNMCTSKKDTSRKLASGGWSRSCLRKVRGGAVLPSI